MSDQLKSDILTFPENHKYCLRKRYNLEKPERMEEALEILEDWIRKQPNFLKKDFRRQYIETCLITCKGSIERTKGRIEKLCLLRTLLPDFYSACDPRNLAIGNLKLAGGVLPKMGYDQNRVVYLKDKGSVLSSSLLMTFYKFNIFLAEYLRLYDYSNGYVIIFNLVDTNLADILAKVNLLEIKNFVTLLMEGYGMRLKGLHLVVAKNTLGKTIDIALGLFKTLLPENLAGRVHVHKTLDAVYQYVPREIVPAEYGGQENITGTELWEKWVQILSSKEMIDFMIEMKNAKVDESFRKTDKYYEKHFGMPGTFRKLDLD